MFFRFRCPRSANAGTTFPSCSNTSSNGYAKKAGKRIRTISKKTLELFQAYDWPGNIRQLQNVVKRAVVLCDGETFSVDETWLKCKLPRESPLSMPTSALGRLD